MQAYEGDHSRRDGSPPPRPPRLSTTSTETPCQAQLERWNTLERLQSVYHKPINDAATALGMGVTVLKKQCRDRGITRWPYRKLSSLDKLIASVEAVRCVLVYTVVRPSRRVVTRRGRNVSDLASQAGHRNRVQVLKDDAHDEASRDAWQSLHDLRDRICDDPSEVRAGASRLAWSTPLLLRPRHNRPLTTCTFVHPVPLVAGPE